MGDFFKVLCIFHIFYNTHNFLSLPPNIVKAQPPVMSFRPLLPIAFLKLPPRCHISPANSLSLVLTPIGASLLSFLVSAAPRGAYGSCAPETSPSKVHLQFPFLQLNP